MEGMDSNETVENDVFVAEKILKKRLRKGRDEFFVKWKDWTPKFSTWEPRENILDDSLIEMFEKEEMEIVANGGFKKRGRKPKRLTSQLEQQSGERELCSTLIDMEPLSSVEECEVSSNRRIPSDEGTLGSDSPRTSDTSLVSDMAVMHGNKDYVSRSETFCKSKGESSETPHCSLRFNHVGTAIKKPNNGGNLYENKAVIRHSGSQPGKLQMSRKNFKLRAGYKQSRWNKPGKTKVSYCLTKTSTIRTMRRPGRQRKNPLPPTSVNPAASNDLPVDVKSPSRTQNLDMNWMKNEIVITDINANSNNVTFTESQTKESIFTT